MDLSAHNIVLELRRKGQSRITNPVGSLLVRALVPHGCKARVLHLQDAGGGKAAGADNLRAGKWLGVNVFHRHHCHLPVKLQSKQLHFIKQKPPVNTDNRTTDCLLFYQ